MNGRSAEMVAAVGDEGGRSALSGWLVRLYGQRRLRRLVARLAMRLERGAFYSQTLREILARFHGVTVGAYSYGPCLVPGRFPRGTKVGNYCSIAEHVSIYRRNHPSGRISQHPFFYNHALGLLERDSIELDEANPLAIGHDVWIGDHTIITPGCRSIGDGSVIGAGSVVTRDVAPYTIVAGNPAKLIRRRFTPEVEAAVRESRWWEQPISMLVERMPAFLEMATVESVLGIGGSAVGRAA